MNSFVVGIGELLWDMLPEGKKMGGAPANFAYNASQFGLNTCVVSTIGQDDLGEDIIRQIMSKKLCYFIERLPYPTGTVQVDINKEGVPKYQIEEHVAWDNIPCSDTLLDIAHQTKAVCFGSLAQRNDTSRETINAFLDAMPEGEGQMKIFDVNLRQNFYTKNIIEQSLNKCNILKINNEELYIIYHLLGYNEEDNLDEQCRRLLCDYRLKMVVLTCGTEGSYVFAPNFTSFQKTPVVSVADTVGAGDSFTAAFCASLLKGQSLTEAHKIAVNVSAFVCTQHGAMPQLPTRLTNTNTLP